MAERNTKPEEFNQARIVSEEQFATTQPVAEVVNEEQSVENDIDSIASTFGVEMDDREKLKMAERLERRDENRWELDCDSAEDH